MTNAALIPPKILLVDDNRDGLLVRRLLLEEQGCTVQSASNGEEGLKLFEAGVFDVIVTDYRMPRMNGLELIVRIRRLAPAARIILISALVEPLGLNEANTGADAVIGKTVNEPAQLARWVKRLLNRAPARKPAGSQRSTPARMRVVAR